MAKFTDDNTEGFSHSDLKLLNTVFDRLKSWFPGVDEKNIADAVNNAWCDGINERDLYASASRSLNGVTEEVK